MNADLDWKLLRDLLDLRSKFHRAVERALSAHARPTVSASPFEPPVDVWEDDCEVVIEAELPGAHVADIDLRLDRDALVISGALGTEPRHEGALQRSERPRGRFHRTVHLPVEVSGTPSASLKNGILVVRLRKAGEGRRIVPISTEAP